MIKEIKRGSDQELIFRVKSRIGGIKTDIGNSSDDFDYPLIGMRLFLTSPERTIFAKFGVDIGPNNAVTYPQDYEKIHVDSFDEGIFHVNLLRILTTGYPVGSYFGVLDLYLENSNFPNNYFVYTINEGPLYLGEIIDDEG